MKLSGFVSHYYRSVLTGDSVFKTTQTKHKESILSVTLCGMHVFQSHSGGEGVSWRPVSHRTNSLSLSSYLSEVPCPPLYHSRPVPFRAMLFAG
jgi:hypothetical protein